MIMKKSRKANKQIFVRSSILYTLLASTFATSTLAQAPQQASQSLNSTTSAPAPAPSFLKQAGQALFENAQKKVLHNLSNRMQATPAAASQTPGAPDLAAGSAASIGGAGSTISPLQSAPPLAAPASGAAKQLAPCRSWVDLRSQPIAVLFCIHGLGLQSNSYEFFGKDISKRGIATYAIDVRGFGTWMKASGKTKVNFDECLADIKQSLESIRAAHPGLPVYVLGESMGGAIALRAASLFPDLVDGLISSVPAGERFHQEKTSAKVFLNLLAGANVADVGSDIVNQATKNFKLKAQWTGDPLARLNLSPQELIQFQDFMNFNHDAARKVSDMPVLFVQGNGDTLVKPEGTWELFNSVASKDKSFFAVPGEHLIFEEAQTQEPAVRDQNFRVISAWLATKVGRRYRRGGGIGRTSFMQQGPGSYTPGLMDEQLLDSPRTMIERGNYAGAAQELEQIASTHPQDTSVMALLGKAYYLMGQPDKAGRMFRAAMRLSRSGGGQSNLLNSYLLELAQEPAASSAQGVSTGAFPFAGFGSYGSALSLPARNPAFRRQNFQAKGKIYAFYANWADQCKGLLDMLNQLAANYGSTLELVPVNIEDTSSDALIEKFKVGPIPTVVFVDPSGKVNSTIIGESTFKNYSQAAQSIVQSTFSPAGVWQ